MGCGQRQAAGGRRRRWRSRLGRGPRAGRGAAARASSRRDLRRFVAGAGPPPDSARSRRAANRSVGRAWWAGRRRKSPYRPERALPRPEGGGGAGPAPALLRSRFARPAPQLQHPGLISLSPASPVFPTPSQTGPMRATLFYGKSELLKPLPLKPLQWSKN